MVDYKDLVLWDDREGRHVHVIRKAARYGTIQWWECEVLDYNDNTYGEVYMQQFTSDSLKRMNIVDINFERLIENVPDANICRDESAKEPDNDRAKWGILA